MLVHGLSNPVDAGISADSFVGWVDENDFVEFECGILTNPVRVEDSKIGASSANTLFTNRLVSSCSLLLSDTKVAGLSENATLTDVTLTSTSSDSDSVDDESLLGLVTESAGLIWSGWLGSSVDHRKLAILPGSNSKNESNEFRLLLSPKLFEILVGSHVKCI